ncbi:methyltransferase domain-containing protein [Marinobacteraceae bacterium S3BR75-40.1]
MTDIAFQCPQCHQPTAYIEAGGGGLHCRLCDDRRPAREGFVDFLPEQDDPHSLAQRLMQFQPLTRIYQGPLWRGSVFFQGIIGLDFDREVDLVLRGAHLTGNERVLDLACASGNYSRRLAQAVPEGAVLGLDLSRPMLREATRQPSPANLHYVRASALELPLADNSVDAVVCCAALHLFPDIPRALQEIQRVLAPGGRFVAGVFATDPRWLARLIQASARRFGGVEHFEPGQWEALFGEAGLGRVECLHLSGPWMILKAHKE